MDVSQKKRLFPQTSPEPDISRKTVRCANVICSSGLSRTYRIGPNDGIFYFTTACFSIVKRLDAFQPEFRQLSILFVALPAIPISMQTLFLLEACLFFREKKTFFKPWNFEQEIFLSIHDISCQFNGAIRQFILDDKGVA